MNLGVIDIKTATDVPNISELRARALNSISTEIEPKNTSQFIANKDSLIPEELLSPNAVKLYQEYKLPPVALCDVLDDKAKIQALTSDKTIKALAALPIKEGGLPPSVFMTKLNIEKIELLTSDSAVEFYRQHPNLDFEAFSNRYQWTIELSFRLGMNIGKSYDNLSNMLYAITHPATIFKSPPTTITTSTNLIITFSKKSINGIDNYFMTEKNLDGTPVKEIDLTPQR